MAGSAPSGRAGPVPPARASVGEILAGVVEGPRGRLLELAQTLTFWPAVADGTSYHAGGWSPMFLVRGRQVLHVHFHKPHLISASLAVPGRLGAPAQAAPGVTPRLRERIEREWRAGQTYAELAGGPPVPDATAGGAAPGRCEGFARPRTGHLNHHRASG